MAVGLAGYGSCHFHRTALRGVFECVGEQVVYDAFHIAWREPHFLAIVFTPRGESDVFLVRSLAEEVGKAFDELQRIAILQIEAERTRLHLVEGYQLIYQFKYLFGVFQGSVEHIGIVLGNGLPVRLHALQRRDNKRQRSLQLMRHRGEEVELNLVHFLDFLLLHIGESHLIALAHAGV